MTTGLVQISSRVPKRFSGLSSLDQSFLLMTGHYRVPGSVFNESFRILKESLKEWRDVTLWGPQAALLRKILLDAREEYLTPVLDELVRAFDLSGDISVSRMRIDVALAKMKNAGRKMWEGVSDKAIAVIATTMVESEKNVKERAKGVVRKQDGGPLTEREWETFVGKAAMRHIQAFITEYPNRFIHPEVIRLVDIAEENPNMRSIDKALLGERIERIGILGQDYFRRLSDVEVGRVWNWTALSIAHEQKVTHYQIIAELDGKTCEVCDRLHGKDFTVEPAYETMRLALERPEEEDAEGFAQSIPFPRVDDIDNKLREELTDSGMTPPFHNNCRCDMVLLYSLRQAEQIVEEPVPVEPVTPEGEPLGELQSLALLLGTRLLIERLAAQAGVLRILDGEYSSIMGISARLRQFGRATPLTRLHILDGGPDEIGRRANYSKGGITIRTKDLVPTGEVTLGNFAWDVDHSIAGVFRHEYGHKFYYQGMTLEQRREFKQLFQSRKSSYWKDTVSEYGSTNSQELFSETFSAYTSSTYRRGLLPRDVEAFLDRVVTREVIPEPIPTGAAAMRLSEGRIPDFRNARRYFGDLWGFGRLLYEKQEAKILYHLKRIDNDLARIAEGKAFFRAYLPTRERDVGYRMIMASEVEAPIIHGNAIPALRYGYYDDFLREIIMPVKGKLPDNLQVWKGRELVATDVQSNARRAIAELMYSMTLPAEKRMEWQLVYESLSLYERKRISLLFNEGYRYGFAEGFTAYTSPLYRQAGRLPVAVERYFSSLLESVRGVPASVRDVPASLLPGEGAQAAVQSIAQTRSVPAGLMPQVRSGSTFLPDSATLETYGRPERVGIFTIPDDSVTGVKVTGNPGTGNANWSFKVKMSNGEAGAFKPIMGERMEGVRRTITNTGMTLAEREVLTSIVDEYLGYGLVPETRLVRLSTKGIGDHVTKAREGSLQHWRPGESFYALRRKLPAGVTPEEKFKFVTLDYLIGNTDRHGNNWLITESGKIWSIDNGYTFPNGMIGDTSIRGAGGLQELRMDFVSRMDDKERFIEHLVNTTMSVIDDTLKRLKYLDVEELTKGFAISDREITAFEIRRAALVQVLEERDVRSYASFIYEAAMNGI